ncbi:GM13734 [Drosophila sechellia]|uniref:GM13734 n=1 Tax=Drosophila sechellia TaxID=7238 RepID=B4HXZ9_DROSE|nr:GM13734 [Drosophila sechellia]
MSRHPSDRKVYVGDLGNNARKNDLEYVFGAYGSLRSVWIARNPPGFAFVEFESARDAADAVRGLDGRTVCGRRARVELSTGKYARSRRWWCRTCWRRRWPTTRSTRPWRRWSLGDDKVLRVRRTGPFRSPLSRKESQAATQVSAIRICNSPFPFFIHCRCQKILAFCNMARERHTYKQTYTYIHACVCVCPCKNLVCLGTSVPVKLTNSVLLCAMCAVNRSASSTA